MVHVTKMSEVNKNDGSQKNRTIKSTADLQKIRLDKLMKNPVINIIT